MFFSYGFLLLRRCAIGIAVAVNTANILQYQLMNVDAKMYIDKIQAKADIPDILEPSSLWIDNNVNAMPGSTPRIILLAEPVNKNSTLPKTIHTTPRTNNRLIKPLSLELLTLLVALTW